MVVNQHKAIVLCGLFILGMGACAPRGTGSVLEESEETISSLAQPSGTAVSAHETTPSKECGDPFNGRTPQFPTRF
jgi:hypothetical protein